MVPCLVLVLQGILGVYPFPRRRVVADGGVGDVRREATLTPPPLLQRALTQQTRAFRGRLLQQRLGRQGRVRTHILVHNLHRSLRKWNDILNILICWEKNEYFIY